MSDARRTIRRLTAAAPSATAATGLSNLASVPLLPPQQALLERQAGRVSGPASWVRRSLGEARDLLALERIAPERLEVEFLEIEDELRAGLRLKVLVPCRPPGSSELCVAGEARLALRWPPLVLRAALPGWAFVQIVEPRHVLHPNVSASAAQALCLGPTLPVGIRVREIVLTAYAALCLQTVQLDERDSAGVLNLEAAHYWQANARRMPLSDEPFLGGASGRESSNSGTNDLLPRPAEESP